MRYTYIWRYGGKVWRSGNGSETRALVLKTIRAGARVNESFARRQQQIMGWEKRRQVREVGGMKV